MSHANTAERSTGRPPARALAMLLAALGILAIILGILYITKSLNSVHFFVGSMHHGRHEIRALVSFVVGIILIGLAFFASRMRR